MNIFTIASRPKAWQFSRMLKWEIEFHTRVRNDFPFFYHKACTEFAKRFSWPKGVV